MRKCPRVPAIVACTSAPGSASGSPSPRRRRSRQISSRARGMDPRKRKSPARRARGTRQPERGRDPRRRSGGLPPLGRGGSGRGRVHDGRRHAIAPSALRSEPKLEESLTAVGFSQDLQEVGRWLTTRRSKRIPSRSSSPELAHEPLISPELFEAAQARRDANARGAI